MLCCYIFLGVAVVSLLLPARLLQLSNSPRFYEALGIKLIRKFVQNGEYVNRLIRKSKPDYKVVKDKQQAAQYLNTIAMYNRFHFLCLVFFMLTFAHAIISAKYLLALLIFMANLIYNVCPILLQQYNRARLLRIGKLTSPR
jgi:hypothetical protein